LNCNAERGLVMSALGLEAVTCQARQQMIFARSSR